MFELGGKYTREQKCSILKSSKEPGVVVHAFKSQHLGGRSQRAHGHPGLQKPAQDSQGSVIPRNPILEDQKRKKKCPPTPQIKQADTWGMSGSRDLPGTRKKWEKEVLQLSSSPGFYTSSLTRIHRSTRHSPNRELMLAGWNVTRK